MNVSGTCSRCSVAPGPAARPIGPRSGLENSSIIMQIADIIAIKSKSMIAEIAEPRHGYDHDTSAQTRYRNPCPCYRGGDLQHRLVADAKTDQVRGSEPAGRGQRPPRPSCGGRDWSQAGP